jgi:hypothetical protein
MLNGTTWHESTSTASCRAIRPDATVSVPREDDADRPDPTSARWAELRLDTGELVIYDTEEPTAWIQSTGAVRLEALA